MGSFTESPPFQLCWVVDDIAAAETRLTALTGATGWMRIPDQRFEASSTTVDGVPTGYDAHVSLAYSGAQQIEVIQPVTHAGPYWRWLTDHGPGVHHVGYVVDDVDEAQSQLVAAGLVPYVRGTIGAALMDFAYLADPTLGTHLELMALSDDMKALFDSLIPAGHVNPWARPENGAS